MAPKGTGSREVIAHFEIVWLAISIALWCLLAWFWPSLKHSAFDDPAGVHSPRFVTGVIAIPVILIVWAIFIVRRLGSGWANRWAALWVEEGRLVYSQRKTLDMPLGDILSVERVTEYMSSYYTFRKIPLRLIVIKPRDGKPVKLAVNSFREPADDIVSRIKEKIGQIKRSHSLRCDMSKSPDDN
jgi:hypothetical protein